jgi:hypothetical protein
LNRKTIRHFICKRCSKPSKDLQGGFSQYSEKHETELIYENIDLCDKCFKITTREEKNLAHLQSAIQQNIIKQEDIETLKRFQTDLPFRRSILEKIGAIKVNEEKRAKRLAKEEKKRKRLR